MEISYDTRWSFRRLFISKYMTLYFFVFFFSYFSQLQRVKVSKSCFCQTLRVEHSLSVTRQNFQDNRLARTTTTLTTKRIPKNLG